MQVIQALTSNQSSSAPSEPRIDIHRPEPFSGAEKKLSNFLFACELNFESNASQFTVDSKKIQYVVSLFTGTALQWAQTQFAKTPRPLFLYDWSQFRQTLEQMFGEKNPEHHIAGEIDKLFMKDNHRASQFVTEYFALSSNLSWGDEALEHHFFKHLAP